jgi:prepilin-type N-terminal cleavage/methylation domain-containing protein
MRNLRINKGGFSLVEFLIAMTIFLLLLGTAATLFSKSLSTRQRESSRTDALTSAQAALNVISRELSNSGFGMTNNGIIYADSGTQKLHFFTNIVNTNNVLTDRGEDITYFFDDNTKSILRYDANANGVNSPQTSIIINRISSVDFRYFNYSGSNSNPTITNTPELGTGRVRVTITVDLEDVQGQGSNQKVKLVSDVTLRNSDYMLQQY